MKSGSIFFFNASTLSGLRMASRGFSVNFWNFLWRPTSAEVGASSAPP